MLAFGGSMSSASSTISCRTCAWAMAECRLSATQFVGKKKIQIKKLKITLIITIVIIIIIIFMFLVCFLLSNVLF